MDRASVWGRVVDADGDPPPRSLVYWLAGDHRGPALPLDLHPVARTDPAGNFCAVDLPHGECLLAADCEAFGSGARGARSSEALRVVIPPEEAGELLLRYPFSRKQFARVRGFVRGKDDLRVLRGHKVVLVDPATPNAGEKFRMETRTDREGDFEFPWVPPGNYALGVPGTLGRMDAGFLLNGLPAGAEPRLGIQVARRPPGGTRHAAVARCVDETGAPVPGAEVSILATNFHLPPLLAGEDGVARQGDLPVPPYAAVGRKPGHLEAGQPFGAPGEGPGEVRLVLRRLATVRVVAVDGGTGEPLRRARVAIEHEGGVAENIEEILRPPAAVTPDGGFELAVLPGRVTIRAAYPGYGKAELPAEVSLDGSPDPFVIALTERR